MMYLLKNVKKRLFVNLFSVIFLQIMNTLLFFVYKLLNQPAGFRNSFLSLTLFTAAINPNSSLHGVLCPNQT